MERDSRTNRGQLCLLEAVILVALLAVLTLIAMPAVQTGRLGPPRLCVDNLRQWAAIFAVYAEESYNWAYPRVHGTDAFREAAAAYNCVNFRDDFDYCPDLRAIYPDYAHDVSLLLCPQRAAPQNVQSAPWLAAWTGQQRDDADLGIIRAIGASHCIYEDLITNGDLCYTYLGYRIDRGDDDDPYADEETARQLGLPVVGPIQVAAIVRHLDPRNMNPDHVLALAAQGRDVRDIPVDLRAGLRIELSRCGNEGQRSSIERLFTGYYIEEIPDAFTYQQGPPPIPEDPPPPRAWFPTIPVMWDTVYADNTGSPVFAHRDPDGANVLFLDGHVEFTRFPGKFPVSRAFVSMRRIE